MKHVAVLLAIGALFISFGLYYFHSGFNSTAGRDAGNPAFTSDVSQEISSLKRQVAKLERQSSQLSKEVFSQKQLLLQTLADITAHQSENFNSGAPNNSKGAPENPGNQNFEDMRAAREEAAYRQQERMAAIDASFKNEPIDSEWSAIAMSTIQQALSSDDKVSFNQRKLECRSSMCQLELNIESKNAGKFADLLPNKLGETFPNGITDIFDETNGTTTLIFYFYRDGHQPL